MHELEDYLLGKNAETSGTDLMPYSPSPASKNKDQSPTKTIPKVGSTQVGKVRPHVDVTDKEATKAAESSEVRFLALPSLGRYPLDSYEQVKTACTYFQEWGRRFTPEHRHEYCANLVKRASSLGISVTEEISKYGSVTYASSAELELALAGRASVTSSDEHRALLESIKVAQPTVEPEVFARLLSEFDKLAGIAHLYDAEIYDPFFTTFGVKAATDTGVKSELSDSPSGALIIGNDYVTAKNLKEFALTGLASLPMYKEEFYTKFRKDPIGTFNSLPLDQKKQIARLASSLTEDVAST
jgi:hypothetical protein